MTFPQVFDKGRFRRFTIADSKDHVFAKRLCKRAGAVKFAVMRDGQLRNPP